MFSAKSISIYGKEAKKIMINGGLWWEKIPPIETGCYVEYEFADGIVKRQDFTSTTTMKSWISTNSSNLRGNLKVFRSKDFDLATGISSFFEDCVNITSLDLSQFKIDDNVTSINYMFRDCTNLNSIDLSGLDTKNVTSMSYLFYNCVNLTTIDLSNFDTSKVTRMSSIFRGCTNLKTIDLHSFDTSKVTNTDYMFGYCSNLEYINLLSFNTPVLRTTSYMFINCSSLNILDLSSFNTSSITSSTSAGMFLSCSKVTESYGRTQSDCDKLNLTSAKSPNVIFVVKEAAAQTLSAMSIQPQSTNEENIAMLNAMNIEA